jgi:hypothetical protein
MYSTVDIIFNFSYSDPDYPTSGLTVTRLARVYCRPNSPRLPSHATLGRRHGTQARLMTTMVHHVGKTVQLVKHGLHVAGQLLLCGPREYTSSPKKGVNAFLLSKKDS